jgi:signal transduction histidine kinase/HPt (histidine-containing phosphotransfer) domain-containing protein
VHSEVASAEAAQARENALVRGRVQLLYAFHLQYLSLPFAAFASAAAVLQDSAPLWAVALPVALLVLFSVGSSRLKSAFQKRGDAAAPADWLRYYTVYSGATGAVWGLGAFVWFVPGSFPAQAYLVVAFLAMTAAEFVARGTYRPAFCAHACASLLPLALLLVLDGNAYALLTACLVISSLGVVCIFGGAAGRLVDESILLRHGNDVLVAQMNEDKRAAEVARDLAQASEKAKSAFIASISHEIRTPVNAILGMAQVLDRSDLERQHRDHVKVLLEAGRALKILLDDIIALGQQGEELSSLPDEGCDGGQAARTVARLLQPNAWQKRLRLSVNVASGIPPAAADPRVVRRVLLKVVGNAIKFTERGNIEIAVDSGINDDGQPVVRFRVTDTGPGIPSHLIGTIFEPFAKADDSYARRYNGAGVGLSVAKKLLESVDGQIGVDSEPGAGASFWISIPAASASPVGTIEASEDAAPPSGLSILAFVSDEGMRTSLDHVLAPFGNRIAFATNLSEAARLSARTKYSLAIASAAGVDALAAMPGQRAPILALAGAEERQPVGADLVLKWPASSGALYASIRTVLGLGDDSHAEGPGTDSVIEAAIDAKAFAELEKSLGLKTLIDILQSYLTTAEDLSKALSAAIDAKEWPQAGRVAQDIAGAAGGLGLTALTTAARQLAQGARDGSDTAILFKNANDVLAQHQRVREALRRIYPALAA